MKKNDVLKYQPTVLIIGAGLAGCAAAVALHKQGLDVLLVERESHPRPRFRGEYIQPFAVQTLARLGFDNIVYRDRNTIRELHFQDLAGDGRDVISETTIQYPMSTHAVVLSHYELTVRSQAHAQQVLGEKFIRGLDLDFVSDPGHSLDLPVFEGKTSLGARILVEPRWVIGCDGRQSKVRTKWMKGALAPVNGSAVIGSPNEFIAGCELESGPVETHRYEVLRTMRRGTLASFQLGKASQRLYWNVPASAGNKGVWEKELNKLLEDVEFMKVNYSQERGPLSGAPANSKWMGPAAKGRFLLAGDALAITTPFGGQGITCAMQHVNVLSDLLSASSDINSTAMLWVNRSYSQQCYDWYYHFGLLNNALYYLFFAQKDIFKMSTKHVLSAWNTDPELKSYVGELFGGLKLKTPNPKEIFWLCGGHPIVEKALMPFGSA